MRDMAPQRLVCPKCHTRHVRHAAYPFGEYCSRDCYLSMPFPRHPHITMQDIERAIRMRVTQMGAAEFLGVSYPQFRRVVAKFGLRDQLPANGAASWLHNQLS